MILSAILLSIFMGYVWGRVDGEKEYDSLKTALTEISGNCPIIEALPEDETDEQREDAYWESTKRRRKIAKAALKE